MLPHTGHEVGQARQFGDAAHHGGGDTVEAALHGRVRVAFHAGDEPGPQGLVMALDQERRLRLGPEQAPHLRPGGIADPQAPHRRALFHARRQVHRMAHRGALDLGPAAEQHRPGVDTHAHAEVLDAQRVAHLAGMTRTDLEDLQACAHRALGFVLAQAVHAKGGLDAIAGEAEHGAVPLLHGRGEVLQRPAHQVHRVLGTHAPEHGGGAGDVGKQDAHLAQALRFGPGGGSHVLAQRLDGNIDRHVAEHGALRLELRDRALEVRRGQRSGHRRRTSGCGIVIHATSAPRPASCP
jgi:hypothetical protein